MIYSSTYHHTRRNGGGQGRFRPPWFLPGGVSLPRQEPSTRGYTLPDQGDSWLDREFLLL